MRLGRPRTGKVVECPVCKRGIYRSPSALGKKYCGYACRDAAKSAVRVRGGEAKCAKCREWKPVADFVRGVAGRPHSYCKPCSSLWFHERRGTPPEKRKAYMPAYRLTDEEKRQNKREANRRQHLTRRAAGKAPPFAHIEGLGCLQHWRCAYCQRRLGPFHVDHKTPVSRGGSNDLSNLQLTCPRCNIHKSAMTHDEFLASKRRPVVTWSDYE